MTATIASARHCFRCQDCLGVTFVETANEGHVISRWDCACGGKTCQYLGKVLQNRIVTTFQASVCDHRCTNAPGPNCDCQCGGKNHGSGRTVTYTEGQPLPTMRSTSPANGAAYRAAVEAALTHMDAIAPGSRRGAYLQREQFWAAKSIRGMLAKARTAKTHKGRLSILSKCLEIRTAQFEGW